MERAKRGHEVVGGGDDNVESGEAVVSGSVPTPFAVLLKFQMNPRLKVSPLEQQL
jgi:hypothetical protein